MKATLLYLFLCSIYKTFTLHITYNNVPLTRISRFESFINRMRRDPHLTEYLNIRNKIGLSSTVQGPLISPHRIVTGACIIDNEYGYFVPPILYQTNKWLVATDKRVIPNTDLAFQRIDEIDHRGNPDKSRPIREGIPILERASIEDIRNPENKFYALSCVLHDDNSSTSILPEYLNIVKCKPTLSNPEVESVLTFEIDDRNDFPLQFRTANEDSQQGFFLVTPENNLKVVGVYNSDAYNSFLVHSLAYPHTKLFIDNLVAEDAIPEPISILTLTMGLATFIKNRNQNKKKSI